MTYIGTPVYYAQICQRNFVTTKSPLIVAACSNLDWENLLELLFPWEGLLPLVAGVKDAESPGSFSLLDIIVYRSSSIQRRGIEDLILSACLWTL